MITVTRLNSEQIVVNAGLIESVEPTPDTLITLASGKKLMVLESVPDVLDRIVAYHKQVGHIVSAFPTISRLQQEDMD